MDAIHYKVKENHQYVTKAAYVVLGITMEGRKDILGIWIGEHESSKFWLSVLNDLKSRGVQDVYLFIKALMADLKLVYKAVTEEEALNALMDFKETWEQKYTSCVKSWEDNWDILSTFYAYPAEIRRIIYTTNIIEGLNRQFRQVTKNKPTFVNDDSLKKMLYLASKKIVDRWTQRYRNWDMVLNQLRLLFSDRQAG